MKVECFLKEHLSLINLQLNFKVIQIEETKRLHEIQFVNFICNEGNVLQLSAPYIMFFIVD